MELLNGTPVFLWRGVCFLSAAAVVAGILLPTAPAVALILAVLALLLSGWALLVQHRVRRMGAPRGRPPLGA